MAVFEMGSHGRSFSVRHSIVKDTMARTLVASVGSHVSWSRPAEWHDDVPSVGTLNNRGLAPELAY